MNIDKTMLLLLGAERKFDINGDSPEAAKLRECELKTTHDVTSGTTRLPEKWHGLRLGSEDGAERAWTEMATDASDTAGALQRSALPTASRGRLAQAAGKILGKANATLKFVVPHSQSKVNAGLADIQNEANTLVLGKEKPIKALEARQPRKDFGIGLLDVEAHAQAAWLQPLGWEQQEPMDAAAAETAPGDGVRPKNKKKRARAGRRPTYNERQEQKRIKGGEGEGASRAMGAGV